MVRFLYYKYPALVKPLFKASKPHRPIQVRCGLSPFGAFYLHVPSLNIPLPREEATVRPCYRLSVHRDALYPWTLLAFSTPRSDLTKYNRQLNQLPRSIMKMPPPSGKDRERLSSIYAGIVRVSRLSVSMTSDRVDQPLERYPA